MKGLLSKTLSVGLLAILLPLSLAAQVTAVYPTRVATNQDTLLAANKAQSNLVQPLASSATNFQLTSTASFKAPGAVSIDNEILWICSISGNLMYVCPGGRGFDNTFPAFHAAGTQVNGLMVAYHHNRLGAEVQAIESALGANLSNVMLASQQFNFSQLLGKATPQQLSMFDANLTLNLPGSATFQPSTSTLPSLVVPPGAAPASPTPGALWNANGTLYYENGNTTLAIENSGNKNQAGGYLGISGNGQIVLGTTTVDPITGLTTAGLGSTGTSILASSFRFYSGANDHNTGYGDFRTSPGTGNILISAQTGALYFNYDHGTGGVIFSNGAGGTVGSVDASGNATFNGSMHSFGGKVGIGNTSPNTLLNVGTGTPTTAANGIQFGADAAANLYRSAAGVVKTDGMLQAAAATLGGILTMTYAVANDLSSDSIVINGGSDVTLGPLGVGFGVHPSATAGNRYAFLSVGDSVAMRPLALNTNGFGLFGNVGIGTTLPAVPLQIGISSSTFPDTPFLVVRGNYLTAAIRIFGTDGNADNGSYFKSYVGNSVALLTLGTRTGAVDTDTLTLRGGNVGIGMTSPSTSLYVQSPGLGSQEAALTLANPSTASYATTLLNFGAKTYTIAQLQAQEYSNGPGGMLILSASDTSGTMRERARFDQNGNFGVGNTAPGALLNIGAGTPTTAAYGIQFGTDASANLYRGAAGTIKTDGGFQAGGEINALGTLRSGYTVEKAFTVSFPNGAANQKADVVLGNVGLDSTLEVTVTSGNNNAIAYGRLTKVFSIGADPNGALHETHSNYTHVIGPVANEFAIGDITWDSVNQVYRVQISHRTSSGNMAWVSLRAITSSTSAYENATMGAVYTTDSTVFPAPAVAVLGNMGIGTTNPANTRLAVAAASSATDNAAIGADLVAGNTWTTTGWTGAGLPFTHTTGNTNSLTLAGLNLTMGAVYVVTFSTANRTAGSVSCTVGGGLIDSGTSSMNTSWTSSILATSTTSVTLTPTTDFNGQVTAITIKPVTPISSYGLTLLDSTGATSITFSLAAHATANLFLGGGGAYSGTLLGGGLGSGNLGVGVSALQYNVSGINNVALGVNALENNTAGSANTAIGMSALLANTLGASNVAIGAYVLTANTTGGNNVAIGAQALQANTTASNNTAIGIAALQSNVLGAMNTALGVNAAAAQNGSNANANVAVGFSALQANTTGWDNTAVGDHAMYQTNQVSSNVPWQNTAIGQFSLGGNTSGSNNTAVGQLAGYTGTSGAWANTTGSNNTWIGQSTGPGSATQYSYQTVIGASATGTCSNCIVLGRAADTPVAPGAVMTPATSGAACTSGQFAFDSSYAYFCTAASTWKRVAIATW